MFGRISLAAVLALGCGVLAAQAQSLRFGAGQQGSQNYGVNAALAQAIEAGTGTAVTVQSFGGATAFLPLLGSDELDMAAVVTPDLADALRGTGPFAGMAQDKIKVVAPLLPSPVGLMVRADSGIATIADLKGKRVAWGIPAQASLLPYVEGALANGGLTAAEVQQVPVASVANGVQALVAGSVDATLFALRGGAVVEADAALGGIRWLPFDPSPEAVARMQALAPEAYLLPVGAGAGVVGVKADMDTMAYDYVLVARAGVPDATIAAIATLLRDKTEIVAGSAPVLKAMTRDAVLRAYPGLPFHPAAQAVLTAR